jgi:hypothetical protein
MVHKKAGAGSWTHPWLPSSVGLQALTCVWPLLAQILRLAHSELARFTPVLIFIFWEDQSTTTAQPAGQVLASHAMCTPGFLHGL